MYVIAEIGTNHNGNSDTAILMVEAAAESGVQAVKMNHWDADLLVSKESWWYQRCKDLTLPWETLEECSQICGSMGIDFIIAPWAAHLVETASEIADKLKIASGELTNRQLLEACAANGISTILSTGMATDQEIDWAVNTLEPDVIMHCVSLYPTLPKQVNLQKIYHLQTMYGSMYKIGYSDHTVGTLACTAAYAMGAKVIEKHFNLENNPCTDQQISANPTMVKDLVNQLYLLDKMLQNSSGADRVKIPVLRRNSETGLRE